MSMMIHSSIEVRILEAQSEASKDVNTLVEMFQGLDKPFERKDNVVHIIILAIATESIGNAIVYEYCLPLERIIKKKTKNKAKSTKPDSEWKSKEKTKSKPKPEKERKEKKRRVKTAKVVLQGAFLPSPKTINHQGRALQLLL
ncbi:hypothetical protein Tco_1407152 [Tanacetum coccineum]